jgi:hypothetical protein
LRVIEAEVIQMERAAWWAILMEQAERRPQWQLQDVYKLTFQAALGSEHAAPNASAARLWLEQEFAALRGGFGDPPIELISPDGRLVRVNLRPYLAVGGSLEKLLEAFLTTAAWRGDHKTLLQYMEWAVDLADDNGLPFPLGELAAYFKTQAQVDFPATHHSALYRTAYAPAYRVVLRVALGNLDVDF